MRKRVSVIAMALAVMIATAASAQLPKSESGKDIVYNRTKGNCLACHGFPTMADAEQTGNSGPPMIAMQARFSDKKVLRDKI